MSGFYTSYIKFKLRAWLKYGWIVPSLLFSALTWAHPHSWISVKTQLLSQDQKITAIKMDWEFDAMTSAYTLDGEDTSPEHLEQTLQNLANESIQNMLAEHYFTYFYQGDNPIRYFEAENARYTLKQGKLTLSFELPLEKPQPVQGQSLKLLVFEPSYYIDMTWKSEDDIKLSGDLAKACQVEIIEPTPTPEQMSYAMSLPADADPDNALGQLFTQTAEFHCQD
ncbi:MAG: DUF1007 family protein [Vibrio sp.]